MNKKQTFMDRLLRSNKLETLPEDLDATSVFEYWFKTFEYFYMLFLGSTDNKKAVNRLSLVTNYLSPPGLGSHCRRALAPAPAPELSSTHSLAPAPAPELSSTYALAPAPALQFFNKQVVYHLVFKSFLR